MATVANAGNAAGMEASRARRGSRYRSGRNRPAAIRIMRHGSGPAPRPWPGTWLRRCGRQAAPGTSYSSPGGCARVRSARLSEPGGQCRGGGDEQAQVDGHGGEASAPFDAPGRSRGAAPPPPPADSRRSPAGPAAPPRPRPGNVRYRRGSSRSRRRSASRARQARRCCSRCRAGGGCRTGAGCRGQQPHGGAAGGEAGLFGLSGFPGRAARRSLAAFQLSALALSRCRAVGARWREAGCRTGQFHRRAAQHLLRPVGRRTGGDGFPAGRVHAPQATDPPDRQAPRLIWNQTTLSEH